MYTLKVNNKEYLCKLSVAACIEIEKKLGTNPLNIFMKASEGEIPKLGDLIIIFHNCLTELNHNVSLQDTYKIYEDYCTEGGSLISLISVLADIFKESGFIPKEDNSKN